MTTVFWDTNLFIYLFEENPLYSTRVMSLRKQMLARGDVLCTSSLTVGETLVKPARDNRPIYEKYRMFFNSPAVDVIPFDGLAATQYARIRADKGISRPDAIQLACAASRMVDLFITNDTRLSTKIIPGIKYITSLERSPFEP
jgi:predicted nucleic acid-binding protein